MKLLPDNIKPDKYLGKGIEFLGFAIFLIVIILCLSIIAVFTNNLSLGDLGSYLSGSVGSIVALLVAVFTFLAFYVQYDANKKIQKQFKIQQFESQFYKMLDLHKANIDEVKISFFDHLTEEFYTKAGNGKIVSDNNLSSTEFLRQVDGRRVFTGMVTELESTIQVVMGETRKIKNVNFKAYPNIYNYLLQYAYRIFFFGMASDQVFISPKFKALDNNVTEKLLEIQGKFYARHKLDVYNRQDPNQYKFYPFVGHESHLSHYYRNLFAIVKLIVDNYDDEYGSENYRKARNYLKILRAQLSNAEQHLLYYNYRIGFGQEWDKFGQKQNQFFTKYRMIHNLPVDRIKEPESPREHFKDYILNHCSTKDPLFEWGDYE